MPKQYVLFGRPLPPINSRRIPCLLASLAIFALVSLVYLAPSAIPAGPGLSIADHKFSIPKSLKGSWGSWVSLNPFGPPGHPPARQKNDTYGESSWYSNFKWVTIPFSSSVTLDENRSLLPELRVRTPIYCYYDTTIKRSEEDEEAESKLLLTWRKAWWAQGFKPIILSQVEAMNNPMYEELQRKEFSESLKSDMMQWLAWENMRGGILARYLVFPMGPQDDPLLVYLRRGEFPSLTRWKGLEDGLFAGPKTDITAAIKLAMATSEGKITKDFISALPADQASELVKIDDVPKALAFYDAATIGKKYTKVGDAISTSHAVGFESLNKLVTSHLHLTWQNIFSDGISVLKPLPTHFTHMISPAYELAQRLAHCPESPMPASCPPNLPKCSPCVAKSPMKISTPSRYDNKSTLYTLGIVPHPYTTATLTQLRDKIDIPWIRRTSTRDPWVTAVTKSLLGTGVSGAPRVLRLKEAIASETGAARSLWFSAERTPLIPDDVDWHFGFAIPATGAWTDDGKSNTPVPGPERLPPVVDDPADGPAPNEDDLKLEPAILEKARSIGKSKDRTEIAVRNAIEAWNLADTEAWRFARAYLARSRVERLKWEEDEAKYAGGAGSEKGRRNGWGRWLDKLDR